MVRVRRPAWIALVAGVAVMGFLYYRPVEAYLHAQAALDQRTQEVRELTREHADLARRLRLDESGATLVREARKLGLVRADERLFIVKGVDAWRKARAAGRPAGG